MPFEIKNDEGDTTKMGGKLTEQDPDWAQAEPMPEPPHMKYDQG